MSIDFDRGFSFFLKAILYRLGSSFFLPFIGVLLAF